MSARRRVARHRADARRVGLIVYDPASPPVLNGTGTEFLIGASSKALSDLPFVSTTGAAVVTD